MPIAKIEYVYVDVVRFNILLRILQYLPYAEDWPWGSSHSDHSKRDIITSEMHHIDLFIEFGSGEYADQYFNFFKGPSLCHCFNVSCFFNHNPIYFALRSSVQNRWQPLADHIMRLPVSAVSHRLGFAADSTKSTTTTTKPSTVHATDGFITVAVACMEIFLFAPLPGQVFGSCEMRLQIHWTVRITDFSRTQTFINKFKKNPQI